MVVRHHQIDFASGALVFLGGKVDTQDDDPELAPPATAPQRTSPGHRNRLDSRHSAPACSPGPKGRSSMAPGQRADPLRNALHKGELPLKTSHASTSYASPAMLSLLRPRGNPLHDAEAL